MTLEYSGHARKQMQRRGISELDVEQALKREVRRTPGDPGTIWVHGYAPGRIVKVCVRIDDHNYVITAAVPD